MIRSDLGTSKTFISSLLLLQLWVDPPHDKVELGKLELSLWKSEGEEEEEEKKSSIKDIRIEVEPFSSVSLLQVKHLRGDPHQKYLFKTMIFLLSPSGQWRLSESAVSRLLALVEDWKPLTLTSSTTSSGWMTVMWAISRGFSLLGPRLKSNYSVFGESRWESNVWECWFCSTKTYASQSCSMPIFSTTVMIKKSS